MECNLTVTAKQLNMTQPAVSMALQRLRILYDDPLFVRKGRTMEPTYRARELKKEVDKALTIIKNTIPDTRTFDPLTSKVNFKLNVFNFAEQLLVPTFIEKLSTSAPEASLTISTDYAHSPEKRLRNREIDLHVGFHPIEHPDFHSSLLNSEKIFVVARKEHSRLKGKQSISFAEFESEKHAVYIPHENIDVFSKLLLKDSSIELTRRNIVYYGSSELGVMSLVASTDILTIVPESLVYLLCDHFDFICFEPPFECHDFETHLIWYAGNEFQPQHRWLREFILNETNLCQNGLKEKKDRFIQNV